MALIIRLENTDTGVAAVVTCGRHGYHVNLMDTDAGEFLPCTYTFPARDDAIRYAEKFVAPFVPAGETIPV